MIFDKKLKKKRQIVNQHVNDGQKVSLFSVCVCVNQNLITLIPKIEPVN